MNFIKEYDDKNPLSIEEYSKKLIGKTFRQIIEEDERNQPFLIEGDDYCYTSSVKEKKRNKGNL